MINNSIPGYPHKDQHMFEQMQLLIDALLETGKVDLSEEKFTKIPQDTINRACKDGVAFKIGMSILVTKRHLTQVALDSAKKNELLDETLYFRNSYKLSPDLTQRIIGFLIEEKKLTRLDNGSLVPNFENIFSKDIVMSFCQYRADMITIEAILTSFKCSRTVSPGGKLTNSNAYKCLRNVLKSLVNEKFLVTSQHNDEAFFYNFSYQGVTNV